MTVPSSRLPALFVIGDSISVHYGPFLEKALAGICAYDRKGGAALAMANLDIPRGSNGGHSGMVLEFVRELLADPGFQPDLLFFNAGLHDIKRAEPDAPPQVSLEEYRANLQQIAVAFLERDISAAWLRTTPLDEKIHNGPQCPGFYRYERDLELYNHAADEVMHGAGISVIDLLSFTRAQDSDDGLFCDHVHFLPEIRARHGAFLAGWAISHFSKTHRS